MKSANQITLLGVMGEPPTIRQTSRSVKSAQFPLVTSRRWKTVDGEPKEKKEWHRCVAFNSPRDQLADLVEGIGRQGKVCFVVGRMEYRSYKKQGREVWVSEVIVEQFIVVDRPQTQAACASTAG